MMNSCEPDYYQAFEALLAGDSHPMNTYFRKRRQRQQEGDVLDQKRLVELEVQSKALRRHR